MWDPISDDCGEWGGEGGRIALHGQPGPHWENTFVTTADADDKLKCGERRVLSLAFHCLCKHRIRLRHRHVCRFLHNTHIRHHMMNIKLFLSHFHACIVVYPRLEKIKEWNVAIGGGNQTRPLLCAVQRRTKQIRNHETRSWGMGTNCGNKSLFGRDFHIIYMSCYQGELDKWILGTET